MSISSSFKNNVESGDIINVRAALINSLMMDKSYAKFDEELACAKQHFGDDILQEHGGSNLQDDHDTWDESYCGVVSFDLLNNFSFKRINHLKEILTELHGDVIEENDNLNSDDNYDNCPDYDYTAYEQAELVKKKVLIGFAVCSTIVLTLLIIFKIRKNKRKRNKRRY